VFPVLTYRDVMHQAFKRNWDSVRNVHMASDDGVLEFSEVVIVTIPVPLARQALEQFLESRVDEVISDWMQPGDPHDK
jgi:hypothetical protein